MEVYMRKDTIGFTLLDIVIALMVSSVGLPSLLFNRALAAPTVYSWDGGGTNDSWSSNTNWSTEVAPPIDGTAEVSFSGATRKTPVVNNANPWPIRKILFTWQATGQFILSGTPLSVADSINSQDQGATPQTINNDITFTSATPGIWAGHYKTLRFGGTLASASLLLVRGAGPSTIQISEGARIDAGLVEVSAANAAYGHVTLQLDHGMALTRDAVLKLTPKSGGTRLAKVKLNFSGSQAQIVAGLVLDGVMQPAGIYNAATHPNHFTGTGNLQVGSGGSRMVTISDWSEWGPSWGRAGLSVPRYNAEGMMAPQPGDIDNNSGGLGRGMIDWRDMVAAADGSVNFLSPETFPRIAESRPMGGYEWAGMVEHLHTYMKASDTALVSAVLHVQSSPNPAQLWLNGEPVATGQTIVLKPGWNRLMVKCSSPRTAEGQSWSSWSFASKLTNATANIQFRTTDPERIVLVTDDNRAFRFLSSFTRTDGDPPVFAIGTRSSMDITLRYGLQVTSGTHSNYQSPTSRTSLFVGHPWVYSIDPARVVENDPTPGQPWTVVPTASWSSHVPTQVRMRVRDDSGLVVLDTRYSLSYGAQSNDAITAMRQIILPGVKIGHYTVFSDLLDSMGAVLVRDNDHSFSVVVGAVDRSQDQKPRSLGVVGHWLLGTSSIDPSGRRYPSRLRWMSRVGITRQQKLWEGWDAWGPITFDPNGNVTVGPAPYIDDALALAQGLNIDVLGDLVEGYYQNTINNLDLPGNSQTMPVYGSIAWNNLYYHYGFELGRKYAGQITSWGGINEIDGPSARTADAAEMHVEAAKQIMAGMKAADPTARYISSSLIQRSSSQRLFNEGFLSVPDVVDVHSHPWRAPEPWEGSLTPYWGGEGRTMLVNQGHTGPLIYGEMSSPRGHNPRGAWGHAEDMVKQLAWAINWREASTAPIIGLNYLVAYDAPDYWSYNLGFNNQYGDPLPIVNAANVASRLLDGRDLLPALSGLPAGVSHIRVTNADTQYPETIVVWKTSGQANVTFTVSSNSVKMIDLMGRVKTHTVTGSQFSLTIDTPPQYVQGKF
jgi:hypothetical protein